MPQYVSTHLAPGMSSEEFQMAAKGVAESKFATFVHVYANLVEGFICTVYEADSEDQLVKEFERLGFPYDGIHEIQFSVDAAQLRQMAQAG